MAGRILFVGRTDSRLEGTWERIEAKGHRVTTTRSRKPALELMEANPPAVVVVDLTVPRTGAEKLCHCVRKKRPNIPILLLVDDEQPPPRFQHDRTLSRSASHRKLGGVLLEMLQEHHDHVLRVGSLSLDLAERVVNGQNGTRHLCPKEAQLLTTLMRYPGKVLRHKFLLGEVWETDFADDLGTLWTHISALRSKIEPFPERRVYLHTVRRIGYRLDVWPPAGGT